MGEEGKKRDGCVVRGALHSEAFGVREGELDVLQPLGLVITECVQLDRSWICFGDVKTRALSFISSKSFAGSELLPPVDR